MGLYDITIQDVIYKNAVFHADKVGFVCGDVRWTFAQFAQEVDRLAAGLATLGLEKGDRIGVVALNCHEFLLLYGAAAKLGAIMLPINWRLKPEEIQMILEDCTPKAMVAGPEYKEMVGKLADRCPFVLQLLALGNGDDNFLSIHEVAAGGGSLKEVDVAQNDPFLIVHTAAVEGKARGAVLTHGNMIAANLQGILAMGIQPDDVCLNLLPLFHIAGLAMALRVMHAGGRNVIMKKFNAQGAAEWIEREKVTTIGAFPPMLSMLLDQAEASGRDLSSLKVIGGRDLPETIQRARQITGGQSWIGFGQTETTGFCTICPYDERPGSAGREGALVRMRIVDDYDREVPTGQPGEIVVRGPLVFQKYWNLEKETAYTFRNGWHHTGDIGRMDEKGYLWYVKRKAEKELIKPGGENVYPAEVEKALLEHPDIVEACVFGVPDKQWGEAIKAVCVTKEGSTLESQALIDFVAEGIARYKKPKYVTFLKTLPKGKDGHVDREKVKKEHSLT